jgi:hypothetical protein
MDDKTKAKIESRWASRERILSKAYSIAGKRSCLEERWSKYEEAQSSSWRSHSASIAATFCGCS